MNGCKCECGYRCGGPGKCELGVMECLEQTDGKHFVRDCDHDFTGEFIYHDHGGTVTCKTCGIMAETHDMVCGP